MPTFTDDLLSQDTQVFPIVTIEPPDASEYAILTALNKCYFISTNNVSLNHVHSKLSSNQNYRDIYFSPLISTVPSTKEAIDLSERRFSISSGKIKLHNSIFDGKRFSDNIDNVTSLINWNITIQYVSPNAKLFYTSFDLEESPIVNSDGDTIGYNSWYDLYFNGDGAVGVDYENSGTTHMAYNGKIKSINYDEKNFIISLEDKTQGKLGTRLPKNTTSNSDNILEADRNKVIPMVYGTVDRSPALITNHVLYEGIGTDDYISQLTVSDAPFLSINKSNIQLGNHVEQDSGVTAFIDEFIPLNESFVSTVDVDEGIIELNTDANQGKTAPIKRIIVDVGVRNQDGPVQWEGTPDGGFLGWIDSMFGSSVGLYLSAEDAFSEFISEYDPDCDVNGDPAINCSYAESDLMLNESNRLQGLEWSLDGDSNTNITLQGWISGYGDNYHFIDFSILPTKSDLACETYAVLKVARRQNDFIGDGNCPFGAFAGPVPTYADTQGTSGINNWGESNSVQGLYDFPIENFDELNAYVSFGVGCPKLGGNATTWWVVGHWEQIRGVELFQIAYIDGLTSKDFFVNISGRRNLIKYNDNLPADTLLENPIDIIYDILKREVGISKIDYTSYTLARSEHSDWKFAFSLTKRQEAKSLIEDIAKSTRCVVGFDKDGIFRFNTIQKWYTPFQWDNAIAIKNENVISYKISKTDFNHIYQKVDVQYNLDYKEDDYIGRTPPGFVVDPYGQDLNHLSQQIGITVDWDTLDFQGYDAEIGDASYYGFKDPDQGEVDNWLEFESPYIRDEETAKKLRSHLLQFHRNDHLKIEVKLPLSFISLEIGALVKFTELLGGMTAHGIDYRWITLINHQLRYPLFMVTSLKKDLNSITIECIQMHQGNSNDSNSLWDAAFDGFINESTDGLVIPSMLADTTPPELTIEGPLEKEMIVQSSADEGYDAMVESAPWSLPNATAYDVRNGDVTSNIVVTYNSAYEYEGASSPHVRHQSANGWVELSPGDVIDNWNPAYHQLKFIVPTTQIDHFFEFVYSVSDSTGNTTSQTINVTVTPRGLPVYSIWYRRWVDWQGSEEASDSYIPEITGQTIHSMLQDLEIGASFQPHPWITLVPYEEGADYYEKYVFHGSQNQNFSLVASSTYTTNTPENIILNVEGETFQGAALFGEDAYNWLLENHPWSSHRFDIERVGLNNILQTPTLAGPYGGIQGFTHGGHHYPYGHMAFCIIHDDWGSWRFIKWHPVVYDPNIGYPGWWDNYLNSTNTGTNNFYSSEGELAILGDVNLSGNLDILDIVKIVNHVLGDTVGGTFDPLLADMNQDGIIDILDVVQLVNIVLDDG
jgi:hypothetical protein